MINNGTARYSAFDGLARWAWIFLVALGCQSSVDGSGDGGSVDLASDAFVLNHPDVGAPPGTDPVEPLWHPNQAAARVKSPGQRMHFTAGLPFRMLADANDPNAYQCPPGHPPYVCPDSTMEFFVDGQSAGTLPPDPDNQNLWDLRIAGGLPEGDHVLTVKFTPHGASAEEGLVPIYIRVDAVPAKGNRIELSADLVLAGNSDLDWSDALVIGHGHKVTASAGYSGNVRIRDSLVTGLGDYDQLGIDVTTTGSMEITGSIFEATAPLHLVVNGGGNLTLSGNELRSNNLVTFVSSDPEKSPILDLVANSSGTKTFQGNNVASGIVRLGGMPGWQIGGLLDRLGNIFVGPRCVLNLAAPKAVIQGNYLHHDYYGGFSQGFNLRVDSGGDLLAEHNVIRDSSWPVQSFAGEFRYNLLVNSGHNFVRGGADGTRYHHNLFVHAQAPNSGYNGALFFYSGEKDLVFDHNTIDAGGMTGAFDSPFLVAGAAGVSFASVRANVFSQAVDVSGLWANRSYLTGATDEATVASPRVAVADYNLWHNPLGAQTAHYQPGIVAGTAGAHDVDGDPAFVGPVPQVPYQVDEGLVWLRQYGVSQVLGYYRALYSPGNGSPLVDSGDPMDGAGNDIGAIGAGAPDPADKFGLVVSPQ